MAGLNRNAKAPVMEKGENPPKECNVSEPSKHHKISNYSHFLSEKSKRRTPSILRELTKQLSQMPPDMIPFTTGTPNTTTFPFQALAVTLKDGTQFPVDGKDLEVALQYSLSTGVHGAQDWSRTGLMMTAGAMEGMAAVCEAVLAEGDVIIFNHCLSLTIPMLVSQLQSLQDRVHGAQDWSRTGLMMTAGAMEGMAAVCEAVLTEGDVIILNHCLSLRIPKLVSQLQSLQDRVHGAQDWSRTGLMMTAGAMEGMAAVCEAVLTEGDVIILPVPVYTGTADMLKPLNVQYLKLQQDRDGPDPRQLEQALQERARQNNPMPKLMYVNPIACNPTGRNLSCERKRLFYRLACEYDFLILEDDPYFFLQYGEETRLPSFLSMDVEGRVLRLDSFSKVLSAGLRLGYLTGPAPLVHLVDMHVQTTTIHASSLSQMLASKLLDHWGADMFFKHVEKVKAFYRERRDLTVAACERHLTDLCQWDVPQGGMFLWLRIPSLSDVMELATKHCIERGLLVVPGHAFSGEEKGSTYNFIRLSYSTVSPSQIEQGIQILGQVIKEVNGK